MGGGECSAGQCFCCCFFTGVAGIVSISFLVADIHNTHSECGTIQNDFTYLGTTCNITNISHTLVDDTYIYCEHDGRAPDPAYGCGDLERKGNLCDDKYTVYFTAAEDNHSVVHSSITRRRRRGVNMVCDEAVPLEPTYVLGYKTGKNGYVDCWKPSPSLDTNMYLEQCGYHPADDIDYNNCVSLANKYECGDNTCYKIIDPAEHCKYKLQKLDEKLPLSISMCGSLIFVCLVSCLCLIKMECSNCNFNSARMKSEKRSRRKSNNKEPVTVEMAYARDSDSEDDADMEINRRV